MRREGPYYARTTTNAAARDGYSPSSSDNRRRSSSRDAQRQLQEEYDYYYSRRMASAPPAVAGYHNKRPDSPNGTLSELYILPEEASFASIDDTSHRLLNQTAAASRSRSDVIPESPTNDTTGTAIVNNDSILRYMSDYNDSWSNNDPDSRYPATGKGTIDVDDYNDVHRHYNKYEDYARVSPVYPDEEDDAYGAKENDYRRYQQQLRSSLQFESFLELNAPPLTMNSSYDGHDRCDTTSSSFDARGYYAAEDRYPSSSASLKKPPPTVTRPTKMSTNAVKQSPKKTVEISPGVFVPLRGADETWKAVLCDYYVPCQCYGCDATTDDDVIAEPLFCIQDAEYVICPLCKTVSPMEGSCDPHSSSSCGGGAGLGFTMSTLADIQREMTTTTTTNGMVSA